MRLAPQDPRRNQLILAAVGVAVIASILFAAPWVKRWADATISVPGDRVRTAVVTRGDLVRDVSVQGRIVAAVSPTLYATASGSITLEVDAGEQVITGQVLARVTVLTLPARCNKPSRPLSNEKLNWNGSVSNPASRRWRNAKRLISPTSRSWQQDANNVGQRRQTNWA